MKTTKNRKAILGKFHRYTYAEINLNNIKENVQKIIKHAPDYQYYFSVVKADCYGHKGIKPIKKTIEGGCNYLAVSNLDEALKIRQYIKDTPILCFGFIDTNDLYLCEENDITISINTFEYLQNVLTFYKSSSTAKRIPLKAHLKINTGMNRLGLSDKNEITKAYDLLQKSGIELEGIYTHIYQADNETSTKNQYKRFENLTANIDLSKIKIVHINASDATLKYEKLPYSNGCRLGIAMFGLSTINFDFKSTFKLYSEVIQINKVKDETVGYFAGYMPKNEELIAVIPIGYDDGIIRKNIGRDVFINGKPYKIVGNICMDMLFVKIDETVKIKDKVAVIKDNEHIKQIAEHLDTIPYEIICSIGKRVPRIYINE